jgi:2-enoate reductase
MGGGDVGCETAVVLKRNGNEVVIVEKLGELMALEEMKYHTMVMEKMLKEERVVSYVNSKVLCVKEQFVEIQSENNEVQRIPADLVVVAVGIKTMPEMVNELKDACANSYVIGDAREPNTIREAVYEGDRIGRII